jgi:hypothetical protein
VRRWLSPCTPQGPELFTRNRFIQVDYFRLVATDEHGQASSEASDGAKVAVRIRKFPATAHVPNGRKVCFGVMSHQFCPHCRNSSTVAAGG